MTENNSCIKTDFKCNTCNKNFATNGGLWKHNKKCHNDTKQVKAKKQYFCKNCKLELMSRTTKWRHEKSCNVTNPADLAKKVEQMEQTIKSLQDTIILQTKPTKLLIETESDEDTITNPEYFAFNNLKLYTNNETGYINITPIATIPDKPFDTWVIQEPTLKLLSEISQQIEIPLSQLIHSENNKMQLHPDLATEFIKWVSPVNGIKFAQWVVQQKVQPVQ